MTRIGDQGGGPRDEPPEAPLCRPDEVAVTLRWEQSGDALAGEIVAENIAGHACRMEGKPALTPLGLDGQPLPTQHIISLELRVPSYVVLQPGQRAAARVGWGGWCGEPCSGQVIVGWEGGSVIVDVQGPRQPACPEEGGGNLTSSWFDLLD